MHHLSDDAGVGGGRGWRQYRMCYISYPMTEWYHIQGWDRGIKLPRLEEHQAAVLLSERDISTVGQGEEWAATQMAAIKAGSKRGVEGGKDAEIYKKEFVERALCLLVC